MFVTQKLCISIVFSFSWGHFNSQEKLTTMLTQNFGVTNKEDYGMLWYFWSGQLRWQGNAKMASQAETFQTKKSANGFILSNHENEKSQLINMTKNCEKSQLARKIVSLKWQIVWVTYIMSCYLQMASIKLPSQENCFRQMQWPFFDFMGEKSSYFLNSLLQESKTLKPS